MWIVVGAYGQLGKTLSDELMINEIEHLTPSSSELDLSDEISVKRYFLNQSFEVVLNCAAWTAVDAAEENEDQVLKVNALGPRLLAETCKKSNARLIHISTDYVFNGSAKTPYTTTSPTQPINIYGKSKLLGEQSVLEIGEGTFPIIRTAWLYSKYGKNFAKSMAERALQLLPARVVNDQFGQPTLAKDVARLMIEVAFRQNPTPIIHGTNSGIATWFDFAQEIYQQMGADPNLVSPVDSSEYPTKAKRPSYSVLDHSNFMLNGIKELRDWREALSSEVKDIAEAVESEMK